MAESGGSSLHYVVVGGGIAGVTCAEQLSALDPSASITVVSASKLIKAVTNFKKVSRTLESFDVEETIISHLTHMCPNVTVLHATLETIDPEQHLVYLNTGETLSYHKLCLCMGASPKLITRDCPYVIGIRDTESVKTLQYKIQSAHRVIVIGNGGIATELVYELCGCEVIWAIKDSSIGNTFFDEGAAKFFLPHLTTPHHMAPFCEGEGEGGDDEMIKTKPMKRMRYMLDPIGSGSEEDMGLVTSDITGPLGSALGPDWSSGLAIRGNDDDMYYRHVHVEYNCEIDILLTPEEMSSQGLTETELKPPENTTTSINSPTETSTTFISTNPSMETSTTSMSTASVNRSIERSTTSLSTTLINPSIERSTASVSTTSINLSIETSTIATPSAGSITDISMERHTWPVFVKLTNGKVYGCDFIVSATGVIPNTTPLMGIKDKLYFSDEDGGVIVDTEMKTNVPDIYAAGDICSVNWPDVSRTWFQMRLWSQARQMGAFAAKCMTGHTAGESVTLDFCFELFAHVTKFFGYKVVLLGRYNAQGLGQDYELLLRVTKGIEYIKVILQHGRMIGAILIGDTDLEETFENLILNQMDLTRYGESLLDPDIDIEDYFD